MPILINGKLLYPDRSAWATAASAATAAVTTAYVTIITIVTYIAAAAAKAVGTAAMVIDTCPHREEGGHGERAWMPIIKLRTEERNIT